MERLPPNALCGIFQRCETRQRAQLRVVCREWLEILSKDSALAWGTVVLKSSDLCKALVVWVATHASSTRSLIADFTQPAGLVPSVEQVASLMQAIAIPECQIQALNVTMPDQDELTEIHSHRNGNASHVSGAAIDCTFAAICSMMQLQTLTLTNITLPQFPETFSLLSELNSLSYMKLSMGTIAEQLSHNHGYQLWNAICSMTGLQELILENCKVKSYNRLLTDGQIPDGIGNLCDLKRLEIRECGLGKLPDSFSKLDNLESFIFIEHPQDCSMLSHLTSLTHLIIATKNSRDCARIPNLKELAVERMLLPDQITPLMTGMWACLRDLDLSNLQLRYIPQAVTKMASLRSLMLHDNNLTTLERGHYLDTLEHLNLENNDFQDIPVSLKDAQHLIKLSLKGNDDLCLTEDGACILASLPALKQLDLRKDFCNADDDFMDLDLCSGWGPTSLRSLSKLRKSSKNLQLLCNV